MIDSVTFFILLAFVVSAFFKGISGLGFSTICLGLLAFLVTPATAIALVIIPSLVSNLLVMVKAGNFVKSIHQYGLLYLSLVPGLISGVWLLTQVSVETSRITLGIVLVLYSLWALVHSQYELPTALAKKLQPIIGLSTGFINGLTGSQVMPVLPYLLSSGLSKQELVQAVNISFTFSSLVVLFLFSQLNIFDYQYLLISIPGIALVFIGVHFGSIVQNKLDTLQHKRLTQLLLLVLGSTIILKSF